MDWKSKFVGHDRVDPKTLIAHPLNYRTHPPQQKAALRGSIREVGFIRSVTVNKRSGRIVDGHERVEEAVAEKQPLIDVEFVDLSEDEERKALALLDPISAMAEQDDGKLSELLADISSDDEAIQAMLKDLTPEQTEAGETELKQLDVKPPPKMTWCLVGIDTVRFGEINEIIERLATVPDIILETTSNDGP